MGDYTIKAAIDINSTPGEVRRWLDNVEGIGGWWSDGTSGGRDKRKGPESSSKWYQLLLAPSASPVPFRK